MWRGHKYSGNNLIIFYTELDAQNVILAGVTNENLLQEAYDLVGDKYISRKLQRHTSK